MENIPGYIVKRKLGSGGMADVYLATQESFGRDVALKILSPTTASNEEFAARFIREAKIVAGLSHPHIIPVYDVGKHASFYYISMDYLSGGELENWIKSGIPENEILQIMEQIADALQYAHHKGYMHRDIKPANIMFREDNSAVLTDFGIARLQNASDQLTQAGMIVGTPKYMSPETIRGKEPDGRADVYALGIVFYEMLMKDVPYKAAEFTALAVKHVQDPIPTLPRAYANYQNLLNKLLAKAPAERYQSGREIIKAIQALRKEKETTLSGGVQFMGGGTVIMSAPPPVMNKSAVATAQQESSNNSGLVDGLSFDERAQRKGGIFKKYTLVCNINTNDAHSLAVYFGNAGSHIIEWHKKRKDSVDSVEFNFTTESWCFDKADQAVIKLYKAGGVYEFLKKLVIKVSMVSINGSEKLSYMINTKGEKILAT